jgi:hypothetical protein
MSEEERRRRLRRTDRSFVSDPPPLGPRRPVPRSARGLLAGPRRPTPRPRARRGAPVLHHHNHWVRRHHNHHHRRVCHRHHHPGAISPRGTSRSSTSSSRSSGHPTSRSLKGLGPQESEAPFLLISLFTMSTGLNPPFVYQGLFPLCTQGRASLASGCCR